MRICINSTRLNPPPEGKTRGQGNTIMTEQRCTTPTEAPANYRKYSCTSSVLLQEERPRCCCSLLVPQCELSSISIDFMWWLHYLSMGLYRTTVTYFDSNLWVTPRATSGWAPQPFSMNRWFRTMCWGRAHTSSECCELRTPR